ncbi:LptF/LptG family permease [Pelagibacterales bacterium SAG-MED23]|nr:LptF/LptG family permease [Pelagibacterales bacterium SAG-MED23]
MISSLSITFIVWIIQAVNLLDLVSDDGHSLNVYFYYVSLNLPKIFSKTIIFVFFISVFYVINKYNNSNELIVFWSNGIKKIHFVNFILKLSILFLIIQLVLNLFIVPKSQSLARIFIKESNIDFLPKLISEKKFINVVKNLTIFVEEYKKNGLLNKIYINEKINKNKSKIIVAEEGKIIKKDNRYILRLYNGGITNLNENNTFALNFSETDYDLSNFSTKTVTYPKMQELKSEIIFNCFKKFFFQSFKNIERVLRTHKQQLCENRQLKSISEELYKRLILPFYTLIISLIAASLIIEPKSKYLSKFHKINIFLIGSFIIILSQLSIKYLLSSVGLIYLVLLLPIVLVFIYYFLLLIITNLKLNYL